MGRGGVAVTEEHVVQPRRDRPADGGGVHEVADGLQDRLEVVLLGFAPNHQVQCIVAAPALLHCHNTRMQRHEYRQLENLSDMHN